MMPDAIEAEAAEASAPEVDGGDVEFLVEGVDDVEEGGIEDSPEGEIAEALAPVESVEVVDPRVQAAIDRLERKERQFDDVIQKATRPQAKAISDEPPVNPDDIKTMADWIKYDGWRRMKDMEATKQEARAEAQAVSSAARLRGELADLGDGFTYDDIHGKYVEPLLRDSPAVAGFLGQTADPAKAAISLGLLLHLNEMNGGNYTKTVRQFKDFVTGKNSEAKQVQQKVQQQVKRQGQKAQVQPSQVGVKQKKVLTADDITNMSDEQYAAWRKRRGTPI